MAKLGCPTPDQIDRIAEAKAYVERLAEIAEWRARLTSRRRRYSPDAKSESESGVLRSNTTRGAWATFECDRIVILSDGVGRSDQAFSIGEMPESLGGSMALQVVFLKSSEFRVEESCFPQSADVSNARGHADPFRQSGKNPQAAEQLLPLIYDELRRLAVEKMDAGTSRANAASPALVHEAYMRLVDGEAARNWDFRGHFFSAAAEAMRRILIGQARASSG